MSYLGELRQNIRPLAAASLGSGTGVLLYAYAASIFAPHLIKQFGWSRAEFALIGITMLTALLPLPIIGRSTDRLGVRRVALTGTLLLPLCYVGFAFQPGNFGFFVFLSAAMAILGTLTSTLVYTRLIASNFQQARGLALTIVNCTPPVLAAIMAPLLNWGIESYGLRAPYLALGAFALVCGLVAVLLIPESDRPDASAAQQAAVRPARQDFGIIFRSKVFWLVFVGMFLCLLGGPLHASQMNVMLLENGLTAQAAAGVVSVYVVGTLIGRLACGLALDRFPTPYVGAAAMILPAVGYALLASSLDTMPVIVGSMFLVGLAVGAESDVLSFVVARYFELRIYSSALSILFFSTYLATAVGSSAISLTLKLTNSFSPYLYFVSGTVLVGSLLFLLLPHSRDFKKIG